MATLAETAATPLRSALNQPSRAWTVVTMVVLSLIALAIVFPFIWMVFTSFKPEAQIAQYPPKLFPDTWTLENYQNVWSRIPFARLFLNSIVMAGGVTLISLLLDSMAAYALSRLEFPGRDAVFIVILIALMLPFQVMFIPLYVVVHDLGLLDSYSGLIVPRATNAFGIFMLRQFFMTLPKELDEAARIDGASEFGIYWRIILPLSGPALATLAIFHFMYNWNDFLWPLLITSSTEMRTLPAGLALFVGQHVVEYGVVMAGAVLTLLPLLVAFLFAQRYFIQGIAMTGIKD
jgi:multiple sugar transport system permease protein